MSKTAEKMDYVFEMSRDTVKPKILFSKKFMVL